MQEFDNIENFYGLGKLLVQFDKCQCETCQKLKSGFTISFSKIFLKSAVDFYRMSNTHPDFVFKAFFNDWNILKILMEMDSLVDCSFYTSNFTIFPKSEKETWKG